MDKIGGVRTPVTDPIQATMRLFARTLSLILAASLLAACGTSVQNPVTGQQERTVMDLSLIHI